MRNALKLVDKASSVFEVHGSVKCLVFLYSYALKLPIKVPCKQIIKVAYHVFRKQIWYSVFGAGVSSLFSYHMHPLQSRNQL